MQENSHRQEDLDSVPANARITKSPEIHPILLENHSWEGKSRGIALGFFSSFFSLFFPGFEERKRRKKKREKRKKERKEKRKRERERREGREHLAVHPPL